MWRGCGWLLALLVVAAGCASQEERAWRRAEALWQGKQFGAAHQAWRALDQRSPWGAAAHARLAEADGHYRRGIALLAEGKPGVSEAISTGVAVAPMDPALYLPLARACRDRGLREDSASFYHRFLEAATARQVAIDADVAAARRELEALPGDRGPVASLAASPPAPSPERWPFALAGGGTLLAAIVALAALLRRGRRRLTLSRLLADNLEAHPSIRYQIGCLRHELLKHRVAAIVEVVPSLAADPAARDYVLARLYGGEPLLSVWRGHVAQIGRVLGLSRSIEQSDAWFADAGRAIAHVARLEPACRAGDRNAVLRLGRELGRLVELDRKLGALTAGLVRCTVDEPLLREVIDAVRGEYAAGQVELDQVSIGPVPAGIVVEVYRFDLLIILKNLVRNAILAVGRGEPPRRVALDVRVDVEPTGEELVRIRVRDTSPEALRVGAAERRGDRGLGLVSAAVERYDGVLTVTPDGGDYAKSVEVRLFRALAAA